MNSFKHSLMKNWLALGPVKYFLLVIGINIVAVIIYFGHLGSTSSSYPSIENEPKLLEWTVDYSKDFYPPHPMDNSVVFGELDHPPPQKFDISSCNCFASAVPTPGKDTYDWRAGISHSFSPDTIAWLKRQPSDQYVWVAFPYFGASEVYSTNRLLMARPDSNFNSSFYYPIGKPKDLMQDKFSNISFLITSFKPNRMILGIDAAPRLTLNPSLYEQKNFHRQLEYNLGNFQAFLGLIYILWASHLFHRKKNDIKSGKTDMPDPSISDLQKAG